MSDRARSFAGLIDDLVADLPLSAQAAEARLGVELQRMAHSNAFFTVFSGTVDEGVGVTRAEVREPTLQSLARGKNGLVVLHLSDGLHQEDLSPHVPPLAPVPVDPFAAPTDGSAVLQAEYPWGTLVLTVDSGTQMVRVAMLDTSG